MITYSSLKSTQSITIKVAIKKVNLNQCVALFLVRPINQDNQTKPIPLSMAPLLHDFVDVYTQPMGLPPSHSIEHTLDLIPGDSFPNAPSYYNALQEAVEIECPIGQLLNSDLIPPSSSPSVSPTFII